MKYVDIVFMQGEEGREVVDSLCNVEGVMAYGATAESIEATIQHLAQWDYGDNDNIREDIGAGAHDSIVETETYVLTWNLGHGYVGLYRKLED